MEFWNIKENKYMQNYYIKKKESQSENFFFSKKIQLKKKAKITGLKLFFYMTNLVNVFNAFHYSIQHNFVIIYCTNPGCSYHILYQFQAVVFFNLVLFGL